jgi:hypothetical protein
MLIFFLVCIKQVTGGDRGNRIIGQSPYDVTLNYDR